MGILKFMFNGKLEKLDDYRWLIPKSYMEGMRVNGIIYADEKLLPSILKDNAPIQVANSAHLQGIVCQAMAMPDIHWGYGLPIGGVVATDIEKNGVITPGGVGYDINCGVRLIATNLMYKDIAKKIKNLIDVLFSFVPSGVGSNGKIKVDSKESARVFIEGAKWAVNKGYGWDSDLIFAEENGAMKGADPSKVSSRAYERGQDQIGTLGSGNHFLEIQTVEEIFNEDTARIFGLQKDGVVIMIHTGSRGLGHQVCTDYVEKMVKIGDKYGIKIPDRQLVGVPVKSQEGVDYIGAMSSSANYAWANRQVITHLVRRAFEQVFETRAENLGMRLIYDVAHNIAKFEKYNISGEEKLLCVHRKGATRSLAPGHKELPQLYQKTGQPVIIPGDMGRCSYVLRGEEKAVETFYSTCHGAGRVMSRNEALNVTRGRAIDKELAEQGIIARCAERATLREEAPMAYKNVTDIVNIVEKAGLSSKVAKMKPIAVIKG
ncbi:protein belonging to Uncharacterized protein family UPF0027 [Candidatus Omnitrophus magneticus]|uniref:tRNA-splicing ligase RtcB n=1 Tax=Candidatus Omnitrophus magneticus TaxID=1609969 RepID=A0A0F0CQG1_9BACT|nr:protein belonging to Uncharacterized protein family UPF0027 [Candidatus Omnitrophus magneticus]